MADTKQSSSSENGKITIAIDSKDLKLIDMFRIQNGYKIRSKFIVDVVKSYIERGDSLV
jgi:metal-responsive CopG/Arc/MetJ family transcriptional regulator